MIDNPDGSKRVPTTQEILEDVRQRRLRKNTERTADSSINNSRSGEADSTISGRTDNKRPIETSTNNRHASSIESREGRSTGDAVEDGPADRVVARNDGSTNQHSSRPATDSASVEQQYPEIAKRLKKKNWYTPYRDAIKEAVNRPRSTNEPKQPKLRKTLTDQESKTYRDELIDTILWQSEHTDDFIRATTKGHQPLVIWSDLDRDDASQIADFLINQGKKDARIATLVRNMVELRRKVQLGMILAPRAYRTLMIYMERGIGIR